MLDEASAHYAAMAIIQLVWFGRRPTGQPVTYCPSILLGIFLE